MPSGRVHPDHVVHRHPERRPVHPPTVDLDVAVADELTGLLDGPRHPRAEHDGVEAAFELFDQDLAGLGAGAGGTVEDPSQLGLAHGVLRAQPLLLHQAEPVVAVLASVAAVLARWVGTALQVRQGLRGEGEAESSGILTLGPLVRTFLLQGPDGRGVAIVWRLIVLLAKASLTSTDDTLPLPTHRPHDRPRSRRPCPIRGRGGLIGRRGLGRRLLRGRDGSVCPARWRAVVGRARRDDAPPAPVVGHAAGRRPGGVRRPDRPRALGRPGPGAWPARARRVVAGRPRRRPPGRSARPARARRGRLAPGRRVTRAGGRGRLPHRRA